LQAAAGESQKAAFVELLDVISIKQIKINQTSLCLINQSVFVGRMGRLARHSDESNPK